MGFMLFSWSTCLAHSYHSISQPSSKLSASPLVSLFTDARWKVDNSRISGIYLVSIIHTRYCRSCFCQRLLLRSWWSDVLWLLKKGCFSTRKCLSQTSSTRKLWILLLPLMKTPWVTLCVCVCLSVCMYVCMCIFHKTNFENSKKLENIVNIFDFFKISCQS